MGYGEKTLALIFILFSFSSCAHKIIAKNCDATLNTNYFICDSVVFK
jgi:hypothetical protein